MKKQFLTPTQLLWLSLLLSLALALFVERRVFFDLTAINDDVRNQAYWMLQIVDPNLFKHDLIADYFTQPSLISPAVWWIYALGSHWMTPLRFSQFLPFPLIVLSTFCLFKFAEKLRDTRYAFWVCTLFNLFIWTVRNFAGGLPRAFSYPLLFLFLWQYQNRNILGITLSLCLGSLIYPPVSLLAFGIIIYDFWQHRKTPLHQLPKTIWLGALGAWSIGFWRYSQTTGSSHFGHITHLTEALQIPELFPGGRIPLFLLPNFSNHFPQQFLQLPLQMIPHLYITIPVVLLFTVWKWYQKTFSQRWGNLSIPTVIWHLAGISIAFYLLAWCTLFYLYVPERYLQFTLPIVIVFALAGIFYNLTNTWQKQPFKLLTLFTLPLLITAPLWQPDLIHPSPDSQTLMKFLESTPRNSMISANLGVSSNIPPLARRSVLLSHEGYIPFHQKYFYAMKARLKSWLCAYYTTNANPLKSFVTQYPLDYIVVDINDYEKDRLTQLAKNHYHAFSKSFFRQLNHGYDKRQYLLYRLAQKLAVYRNSTYLVVPVPMLKAALEKDKEGV
jgi:hypothetical protein